MKVVESFLTKNPCFIQGKKITVKGLMLHSVGCSQPSASVFVKNWNSGSFNRACVHGFIDGNDGTIYQTLPWDYRGWHAGGSANNTHIGVEMCEPAEIKYTSGANFTVIDKSKAQASAKMTYTAAVELFAELCKQYNLNPTADGVIISHSEGHKRGVASGHADPEHLWRGLGLPYTMDSFREDVKKAMSTNETLIPGKMSEDEIFAFFKAQGMTSYGVAGLMGNLYAESGLKATNLQNSYEKKLGMDDFTYTVAVDTSAYGNFIQDSAGYGLAQWTYWSRKQALFDYAIKKKVSIGDCRMQCEFLMEELNTKYRSVLEVLKKATSIKQASDVVLLQFERPKDQSEEVKRRRVAFSQMFYDKYAEATPDIATVGIPYKVRVDITDLNIRKGPGTNFDRTGKYTGKGVFTIVEEKDGWGKLKSGAGWICLAYTSKT